MNARIMVVMTGLAAILLAAGGARAVDVETVSVGDPGNTFLAETCAGGARTGVGCAPGIQ